MLSEFLRKVETQEATIGIVGIGYVGLPVALTFAEAGFHVVGIDLREEKVEAIEEGRSHLLEISSERVKAQRESGRLRASSSFEPIRDADAVIISVPTPLSDGTPDLSRVV